MLLYKMVISNLRNRNLFEIPIILNDVTELDISKNLITKIENLPSSVQTLDLCCNQITKIENLPNYLQTLLLECNQITKIENLPNFLHELWLGSNKITKIENLPVLLQKLYSHNNNKITKIENLPVLLQILVLSYNQINKIENLPNGLQVLHLHNSQITKIENLPSSVQELYLSNNKIIKIENLPSSVQELYLSNNRITKIENLPSSVQILYLSHNQITKIANLPSSVQNLDLRHNQITKIENLPNSLQELKLDKNKIIKMENLPNSLQKLHLLGNKITKIENLPNILKFLDIDTNLITELPLYFLELGHPITFYYRNNPIENIHPLIERWLERRNRRITNNNKIYSDGQNIHNSSVQKSFRNSLGNLLKDKNILTLNICKKHVIECNKLEEQVKRELLNYCDDDTEHSIYLVKFDEVFRYVVNRIVRHSDSTEMFKILNEEIKDTICKCFTGRMARLVNVLNGFYDDITIHIGSNEQISNIIVMLREQYEGDELVKQIRLAMEERDYDNEVIEEWLTYVKE
jgi:hypothetical protein